MAKREGVVSLPRDASRISAYWSRSSEWSGQLAAHLLGAVLFTALSVLGARAAFWLPFSPVPVTLQVLAVVLAGLVLGPRWGALSLGQYLLLGLSGWPVFAAAQPGPAALLSPTAGYLLGFIAGAYVAGLAGERWAGRSWPGALASGLAGVAAIYICGVFWLAVCMASSSALPPGESLWRAFLVGVVPFAPLDAAKAALAASVWRGGRLCLGLLLPSNS